MLEPVKRTFDLIRDSAYALPAPPVCRGIVEMLARTFQNFIGHDGSHMAAGVAFFSIFSLFPLALGTTAIAGFFLNPEDAELLVVDFLEDQLSSTDVVRANIKAIADAREAIGLVALAGLLWTSRAVFGAIHRVLNRAWNVSAPRHFLLYQLGQVASVAGIVAIFLVALTAGTVGTTVASQTDRFLGVDIPWWFLFSFSSFAVSTSVFLFIYKVVPDVKIRWRDALPAAVLASVLFEISKVGFALWLSNISRLDLVYGSVTAVIALMLFLYVGSLVLVFGAEFSSEYSRSTMSGRLGSRGPWHAVPGGLAPPGWVRQAKGRPPAN
jgi:membrane protein